MRRADGYNCTCNIEFYGDGYECEDFDDCGDADEPGIVKNVTNALSDTHGCHSDGRCSNKPGFCSGLSNDGYNGDGIECADSNECGNTAPMVMPYTTSGLDDFVYGAHTCNDNAECSNIPGNYRCLPDATAIALKVIAQK